MTHHAEPPAHPDPAPVALPDPREAVTVVAAPRRATGCWAGAPSATVVEGQVWLAYRVRRPEGDGRGLATLVARSADGFAFTTVAELPRELSGAESVERPALLRRPDGGWRVYLSCATPGTKHWWIEAVDASTPDWLVTGRRTVVLPGDDSVGVKDPVVRVEDDGRWHVWYTRHPLTEPGHEDRMTTAHAVSEDGLTWRGHATVLRPEGADRWDSRGTRLTAVLATRLSGEPLVATYDGRASAAENWFEATGTASGSVDALTPVPGVGPVRSPWSDGACRYATTVVMPDGARRWYLELARPDGSHDLVTWPPRH